MKLYPSRTLRVSRHFFSKIKKLMQTFQKRKCLTPKRKTPFQKVPQGPNWKELFRLVVGPPNIHW